MSAEEKESFVRELASQGMMVDPAGSWLPLRAALRAEGVAPELGNAEFFNQQLVEQIFPATGHFGETRMEERLPSLWRLVLGGLALVAVAVGLFLSVVPNTPGPVPQAGEYVAQIVSAKPGDGITAYSFQPHNQRAAVLWLEGMDYIPRAKDGGTAR